MGKSYGYCRTCDQYHYSDACQVSAAPPPVEVPDGVPEKLCGQKDGTSGRRCIDKLGHGTLHQGADGIFWSDPLTAPPVGGTKHDGEKPRLDLLDPLALEEVGRVLTFGAKKYDAHNWRKGFAWSRLIAAALRHLWAFARGEDRDPETGLSHLAHASCCLMFLLNFQLTAGGTDDRWKGVKP